MIRIASSLVLTVSVKKQHSHYRRQKGNEHADDEQWNQEIFHIRGTILSHVPSWIPEERAP
jgi:hypothetical protein